LRVGLRSEVARTRDRPHLPPAIKHRTRNDAEDTTEERDEMTDNQVVWLTQESHDRLKAELDQLIANRPIIAAEINDRREEGDLRENGGYHAAREQQGQEEARIRQLQELLNTAKVGEAPKQSGVALPGSVVKVYYDADESDSETFLIATRQEIISDGKLEVYSPNSPLGSALLNAKVGETRTYTVPSGSTVKVTLVSAEPYHS
jgi:transcription elongation factor GreA